MTESIPSRRLLSVAAPVFAAIILLLTMRAGRPPPSLVSTAEPGTPVRVVRVNHQLVVPRAVGYGVIEPAYEWELVAEVSGRVAEMNPELRVGRVLAKGAPLLKIDPQSYHLAAKQRRASLENVRAQMQQLRAQRRSTLANLELERASLTLVERDLSRTRALFGSGGVTQAEVDSAQRSALAQRGSVQALENQLQEIPARMAALRAQEQESKLSLEGAALDVGRTTIAAPFDIRIRTLAIQPSELVTAGQVLAVADGVDAIEVPAQLTFGALQPLFVETATAARHSARSGIGALTGGYLKQLGIRAVVRIESGDLRVEWAGEVTRMTTVDATTRTVGVVVTVGDPVDSSQAAPPLLRGLYAEVELTGKTQPGCLAVPRAALRAGSQVYVADKDSRLDRRAVVLAMRQANFVCIRSGLEPGDAVVLTDLQPAVQGMLLLPVADRRAAQRLLRDVRGEGSIK